MSLFFAAGSPEMELSAEEFRAGLFEALDELDKLGERRKVLAVPPDFTRFHSKAGDFTDLAKQLQQMRKMGGLGSLINMLPGMGKMKDALKNANIDDKMIKRQEAIIQSMTPYEKSNPDSINQSRRNRIAKGSGTNLTEVNRLIKQFEDMRKVMKQMSNPAAMANMMRRMPK